MSDVGPEPLREEVEILTEDRIALRATVVEPAGERPRAVCVFTHAMFARRTEWDRPRIDEGWLTTFARAGARAIALDFRGHGDSGKTASEGGFWSYDDLVQRDLPAVVEAARARADGAPVVLVGHSAGGNIALAAQAAGFIAVDRLVMVASNGWIPRWDPLLPRRALKAASIATMKLVTARVGYYPARRLRIGSDDEAAPFIHDIARFWHEDAWTSGDGSIDYAASLASIRIPVLAVASQSDHFQCATDCVRRMVDNIGGRAEIRVVTEGDGGSPAPEHFDLVIGERSRCVRDLVLSFCLDRR